MGETTTSPANVLWDAIRSIFSLLDWVVFGLLNFAYQIFFNVTSANLFSNETVMKFYGRIQLIIGVFMMFQLAMTILKGIMDPDSFTNNKSGASNLIMRIATALILLTVLVPINIPYPKNEYEIQINNNGLLFGTLYSLQHRILSNNTLGRLILGNDNSTSMSSDSDDLKTSSRIFTSTILKGFYRINLLPEDERPKHEDGKDDSVFNDNRMCKDIDDDVLAAYTRLDADPSEIISMVNLTCEIDDDDKSLLQKALSIISPKLAGTNMYVFTFMPVISTIVGGIFTFILFSFGVDVAVRAIKLVILRLIAPIPIIMYMDPKGGKDSSFSNWVKSLTSTYLDLFIRLATVYFVIFLIQDMMVNGIVIDIGGSGLVSIFSHITIWIGLFIFAKQAPKFIKQVLGIKEDSGKLFGGFGEALALGAAAGGVVGSAATSYRASKEENDQLHQGQTTRNLFRNVGSAITGAISGGYAGAKAFTGKDASVKSVLQAQSQLNAQRAAHSTLTGRVGGDIYGMFAGRSLATRDQGILDANKAAASSIKTFKTTAVDEAMKKGESGRVSKKKDRFGKLAGIDFNYRQLEAAMNSKDTSGNFSYTDHKGNVYNLNAAWFDSGVMADIEDSQTANYLRTQYNPHTGEFENGKLQTDWRNAKHDMTEANIKYRGDYLGDINVGTGPDINGQDYAYSDIGKRIGDANAKVADMNTNMKNIMHRANSQNKK